jgi:hypothetical protein
MEFKVLEAKWNGMIFRIEEDWPEVGAYLYINEENGKGLYDYLQNNIEVCMEQAFEDFGVPMEMWVHKPSIQTDKENPNKGRVPPLR